MYRFRKTAAVMVATLLLIGLAPVIALPIDRPTANRQKQAPSARHSDHSKSAPRQYPALTAAAGAIAVIPGIPNARFWADSKQDFAQALPNTDGPWLALSGGGADGAYGAGLLVGWTQAGDRPEFSLVTGASAGALAAPFVFAGPAYDPQLRAAFTGITAGDVFEVNKTAESFLDTWPLKELIAKRVTPELLRVIAAEHRRGRRLFVVTTNLDAGRPVAWDMGIIAARGDEAGLRLFRDVLLASASIPAFFPPVRIEVEAQGQRFEEVHADGTVSGPFYVAPDSWLTAPRSDPLPTRQIYIVVNGKLEPEFEVPEPHAASLLGRTFSVALKAAARAQIAIVEAAARRDGRELEVAYIDQSFNKQSHGTFDQQYMKALFALGVAQARNGTAFRDGKRVPGVQANDHLNWRQQ
jgi:predicted acylesterase/phospholipase RssA